MMNAIKQLFAAFAALVAVVGPLANNPVVAILVVIALMLFAIFIQGEQRLEITRTAAKLSGVIK